MKWFSLIATDFSFYFCRVRSSYSFNTLTRAKIIIGTQEMHKLGDSGEMAGGIQVHFQELTLKLSDLKLPLTLSSRGSKASALLKYLQLHAHTLKHRQACLCNFKKKRH